MVPSIFGENMLDDFFDGGFFGAHNPLYDIKDGYLTVSAEKGLDKKEEDKKGRVLRQERYAGVCSRSFYVGNVKPEEVKAKYESGVLSVVLPKVDQKKLASESKIAIE